MIDSALGLGAAFAAGLAGSAHCAGMCGGIAAAAGASFGPRGRAPLASVLSFNLARIASYAGLGAVLAVSAGSTAAALPIPALARTARFVAAIVLAALALRLWSGRDVLGIERVGAAIWRRLAPAVAAAGRLPAALRPAGLGALWGFMPCGLVYSVLLVAVASGSAATAAETMLAFGAGTLPALIGLSLGAVPLGRLLAGARARRLAAVLILLAAVWTAAGALLHGGAAHEHHHHAAVPASG